MIAHTLPILTVAVALGVRALPMPAPQGVTALIAPGRVLDSCIINYPGVYGISIRGVGSSAASLTGTAGGAAAAAGSGVARGAGGAASGAPAAAVGGGAEKLRRRQAATRIPDGQFHVVPALEPRAPETPAGSILTLEKAAGPGAAVAGSATACGSGATGAAGAVTQIADGQTQAHSAVGSSTGSAVGSAAGAVSGSAGPASAIEVVTQIADGQIRAPGLASSGVAATGAAGATVGKSARTSISAAAGAATRIADGQVQAPQKRSILKVRQNGDPLQVTLKGGVLTDTLGRIGYIADNHQLQFDAPPQAGAIYTAGFSACPDGTLALGDSNVFYACGSSDFTNLYDTLVYPDNCHEVKLFLV